MAGDDFHSTAREFVFQFFGNTPSHAVIAAERVAEADNENARHEAEAPFSELFHPSLDRLGQAAGSSAPSVLRHEWSN